jgi:hypothetical protein
MAQSTQDLFCRVVDPPMALLARDFGIGLLILSALAFVPGAVAVSAFMFR